MADGSESGVKERLNAARKAQAAWAAQTANRRADIARRLRRRLAAEAPTLIRLLDGGRGREHEALMAEILPLADACRFLEREAPHLLATRRLGRRGRPAWLFGVDAEVERQPLGVVLVIAPDNYPLFLAAAPALQALVAGNAALIKPAPGWAAPVHRLAALLAEAGLPPGLLHVLDEPVHAAAEVINAGVDHVVLTASASTGTAVLSELAPRLTPATLELSGCDAVFVLPGADLELVADALLFGLRFNAGATCIAPRRVFIDRGEAQALEPRLAGRLADARPMPVAVRALHRLLPALEEARRLGARILPEFPVAETKRMRPTAVFGVDAASALLNLDVFAPVLSVIAVNDMQEALQLSERCPYALGASIFGAEDEARTLARRVRAGSITINDVIVPTTDPRLPFGGRKRSGYGVVRGAEGLLAMTAPQAISVRRGRFRPHYADREAQHTEIALAYLAIAHSTGVARWRALSALISALRRGFHPGSTASGPAPLRPDPPP